MTFGHPEFLYGLLLTPFAALFLYWARQRRRQALTRLGNLGLINRLSDNINWRGRRWRHLLWLVVLALLLIASSRPQWGSEVQVVEQRGVEIMAVLDISRSMLAQDILPNRLSRAKLEIADLMGRLRGDQIGLVLFSGFRASFIQFPLTSDYATARNFLDAANPSLISSTGTDLAHAIRTAMQGFDQQRVAQKVIIVLTDGEHDPALPADQADPMEAAREAAADDIIIYTIGFGSPDGEPLPEFDQNGEIISYRKDPNGETILSRLDEITLQQLALIGNGRYFRATPSGQELTALLAELAELQQDTLENSFEVTRVERFQIVLWIALLFMVVMELISERRQVG